MDFTGISQPWLRSITQSWCWDNLNRFNDFGSFIKAVNEIGYFSEYLRTATRGGGEDVANLDRATVTVSPPICPHEYATATVEPL